MRRQYFPNMIDNLEMRTKFSRFCPSLCAVISAGHWTKDLLTRNVCCAGLRRRYSAIGDIPPANAARIGAVNAKPARK
jgi:hypothetical protein